MVYVDTSVLVKLYLREPGSRQASEWVRENGIAIPLTPLHALELTNAIQLKQFRKELTVEQADEILQKIRAHESIGIYYRPAIEWPAVMTEALNLSYQHTRKIGSRSLDIVHIALARSMGASGLFTFDQRQAELAAAVGLLNVELR